MFEITEQNYEEVIGKTNLPVVLDFGATWCGPCQVIKPYIEKMGNTYEGKAIVAKVANLCLLLAFSINEGQYFLTQWGFAVNINFVKRLAEELI